MNLLETPNHACDDNANCHQDREYGQFLRPYALLEFQAIGLLLTGRLKLHEPVHPLVGRPELFWVMVRMHERVAVRNVFGVAFNGNVVFRKLHVGVLG